MCLVGHLPGQKVECRRRGIPKLLQSQRQFEPYQTSAERTIEELLDLMEAVFNCVPGYFQLVSR